MTDHYFTLEDARQLVPWLVQAFQAMEPLRDRSRQLRAGIRELNARMRGNGSIESRRRLEHIERQLGENSALIDERVREVLERGILVKAIDPGLVDFPFLRDGREVYLCWREGESELGFWHDVDAGFAGRQPL
jgi:hypothetical protein